MNVMVDICVVPMGVGVSVSEYVVECQRIFEAANLNQVLIFEDMPGHLYIVMSGTIGAPQILNIKIILHLYQLRVISAYR